jgi:hypothetical protein
MKFRSAAILLPLIAFVALGTCAYAQVERQIPPPDPIGQGDEYGAKFFDQLRRIFGRFRDSELKRVFDSAGPIQCSELATDKGEWREVAFFNENRKLGDWYRERLEEVKGDLAVYIFKGVCGGSRAALQVTTKFPIEESYNRAVAGKIPFDRIDVNVNAPVSVVFDPRTQAYGFDLPYLYRVRRETGDLVYTLNPRTLDDRYATDVMNHWDCKKVTADDVTYQFLICHSTLVPRDSRARFDDKGSFGSSAYSILSDGKEAASSVHLSFGEVLPETPERPTPEPARRESAREPARANADTGASPAWRPLSAQARLIDASQNRFRLRFKPETWKGKIDKAQLVEDGMVATYSVAPRNKDYCVWRPRAQASAVGQLLEASSADSTIHTLEFRKDAQGVVAVFGLESEAGSSLGLLQCSFSQSQTPADITVARWLSIAGSSISLESPGQ